MKVYSEAGGLPDIQAKGTSKNGSVNLIVYSSLIAFLLIARDIAGLSLNKYIFLAVSVGFMAFADFQTLCCMISFLIPLYNGLPGTYIRLVAALLLLAKDKGKVKGRIFGLIAIFSLLEFIASYWYTNTSITDILSYLTTLFLLLYFVNNTEKVDCEKCLKYFVLGTAVFCFVIIVRGIQTSQGSWLDMISAVQLRFGESEEEGMHISANANALGYYCIAGCFSAYNLFCSKESFHKGRAIYLALTVFMVTVGFLSLSRSYVIVFLGISFIYFLSRISDIRRVLGTLIITTSIMGSVNYLVLHNSVAGSIWSGLVVRFNRADMLTGNGRTELFSYYFEVFFSNLRYMLIGTGVTQYREVSGAYQSIHSMLQQILICYGFIGATIFLSAILKPVLMLKGKNHIAFVNYLPIIAVLLFSQTIQFINPYQYMLVYLCGVFAIQAAVKRQTGDYT